MGNRIARDDRDAPTCHRLTRRERAGQGHVKRIANRLAKVVGAGHGGSNEKGPAQGRAYGSFVD
jgi:hypothetical protein